MNRFILVQISLAAIQNDVTRGGGGKLVTKSDNGGKGVSAKSEITKQRNCGKFLNYSNRYNPKDHDHGGFNRSQPFAPWPLKMSTIPSSESSVQLQNL